MNEDFRKLYEVTRSLFEVVKQQQGHIGQLYKSYSDLIDALRGENGLDARTAQQLIDQAAIEKAAADIAILKRLYDQSGDDRTLPDA